MSDNLKELRDKATGIVVTAQNTLNESQSESDPARKEELRARADTMLDEAQAIERDIATIERAREMSERLEARAEAEIRANRPTAAAVETTAAESGVTYMSAFNSYLRSHFQDADPLTAEERAVLRTGFVKSESRAQTTTNSAGGYTVPEILQPDLIKSMLAFGPMYDPGVTREMVTDGGNAVTFPTVNDTTVTAGSHTEGATLTDDGGKDATFGEKTLDAYAFDTEWIRISKELIDDSALPMQGIMTDLLGERLGRIANTQLTTGSGSSAPNGIVTASTLGHTIASNSAVTADEILDLIHSVNSAYRRGDRVALMLNDTTLKVIRKLKDGDGNYLWTAGNIQAGVPNLIHGERYVINDDVADLGADAKPILFGDMSKFVVRKVGAPLIGAIGDKDFWPGIGVAGFIRFDSELLDTAAVKHILCPGA